METSLAEDVQKSTRTLSPDSFFFMSPYRSFSTSGCFRRFSAPADGGDALNGEFQQQMAAAFAEFRILTALQTLQSDKVLTLTKL